MTMTPYKLKHQLTPEQTAPKVEGPGIQPVSMLREEYLMSALNVAYQQGAASSGQLPAISHEEVEIVASTLGRTHADKMLSGLALVALVLGRTNDARRYLDLIQDLPF